MADPRFYSVAGPFSLQDVAEVAEARIGEGADPGIRLIDVQPLDTAGSEHLSFLDNKRYIDQFSTSRAGACLVHPDHAEKAPGSMALLLSEEPYRAYARVAAVFYPAANAWELPTGPTFIDDTAVIGEGCEIAPGAIIGAKADIGENCHIGANSVLGPGVVLGRQGVPLGRSEKAAAVCRRRGFPASVGRHRGQDRRGVGRGDPSQRICGVVQMFPSGVRRH